MGEKRSALSGRGREGETNDVPLGHARPEIHGLVLLRAGDEDLSDGFDSSVHASSCGRFEIIRRSEAAATVLNLHLTEERRGKSA